MRLLQAREAAEDGQALGEGGEVGQEEERMMLVLPHLMFWPLEHPHSSQKPSGQHRSMLTHKAVCGPAPTLSVSPESVIMRCGLDVLSNCS